MGGIIHSSRTCWVSVMHSSLFWVLGLRQWNKALVTFCSGSYRKETQSDTLGGEMLWRKKVKSGKWDGECGWVMTILCRVLKEGFSNKPACKQRSGGREGWCMPGRRRNSQEPWEGEGLLSGRGDGRGSRGARMPGPYRPWERLWVLLWMKWEAIGESLDREITWSDLSFQRIILAAVQWIDCTGASVEGDQLVVKVLGMSGN